MQEQGLERALRITLLPLYPRAAYFPDFLTPLQAAGSLDSGLEAILATPPRRVVEEMALFHRAAGAPSWAPQLAELRERKVLVRVLRAYYETVVAPYGNRLRRGSKPSGRHAVVPFWTAASRGCWQASGP
ncbi:hypothetical protein ACIHCQ_37305 [Streptomyces sp. NPDC052236]|uniref:hypothetical protein n=1 Tax=Streptomyces sp. NPDC052236 TaxID=3365686 RepID=UPI0037D3AFDB